MERGGRERKGRKEREGEEGGQLDIWRQSISAVRWRGHTALDASSGNTEYPQRKLSSGHLYMMSTDAEKYMGTLAISVQNLVLMGPIYKMKI